MQRKLLLVVLAGALSVFLYSLFGQSPGNGDLRPQDARVGEIIRAIVPATIRAEDDKLVGFGTRLATDEAGSTATRGPVPGRAWIAAQYQAISDANGGRLQVKIDTFDVPKQMRVPVDQTMSNVVATLPGTNPDDHRIFVVSGHYDSYPPNADQDGPGANDDASGTLVALESARALAKYSFPATIVFYAVEGEEQGLIGSTHAAKAAKAAGLEIAAVLNNDIVGGDQTPGQENRDQVRIFSQGIDPNATPQELRAIVANSSENDSPSRELARYASGIATWFLPGFTGLLEYRPDRFGRNGDQSPWVAQGYAGIRFTELHENSNHQHLAISTRPDGTELGDTPKWISPDYIANVARLNALTLAMLASAPPSPERVSFNGSQQIGTRITWTAVPGAAGYHLLLRPTAASQWTERRIAPAVAATAAGRGGAAPAAGTDTTAQAATAAPATVTYQMTVPESSDNYFFAIAATDAAGHESLPTLAGQNRGGGGGRGGGAGAGARGGGGNGGGGGQRPH